MFLLFNGSQGYDVVTLFLTLCPMVFGSFLLCREAGTTSLYLNMSSYLFT